MKGCEHRTLLMAKSGWYHGASQSLRPWAEGWRLFVFFRLLKMPSRSVLGRVPPCDVPEGYASVVPLPAALLERHFEQSHKMREVKP
jgi:hypothetical protein